VKQVLVKKMSRFFYLSPASGGGEGEIGGEVRIVSLAKIFNLMHELKIKAKTH